MLYPVENEYRQKKCLNGIWKFKKESDREEGFRNKWYECFPEGTREMAVPASYNDLTTDKSLRDHVGWVWYERKFSVPYAWKNERIVLRFGSVTQHAVVYVNGKEVMRHKGGYLPFECQVEKLVNPGENKVTVAVSNMLDWSCLPTGELHAADSSIYPEGTLEQEYHFDFFNYSGIHRPVWLYLTSNNYVSDIHVETEYQGTTGMIKYEIEVEGVSKTKGIRLLDANGKVVAAATEEKGIIEVEQVHLWNPCAAYLYTLEVELDKDKYELPVGIRTVSVKEKEFLINGKPFYFKGFGKHEDSDIHGKGLDEALNVRDFELLKWIGANSFRTSHYPYSEELMQMADRQGFVVIDEVPAVGMNYFYDKPVFLEGKVDGRTLKHHKDVMTELYERDKNHPCVVMWSLANEAHTNEEAAVPYFREIADYMRTLDRSRPITTIMNVNVHEDLVSRFFDVVCVNRYFGWYTETGKLEAVYLRLKEDLEAWWEKYHRPVLVTEYGADTIAGLHKLPEVIFTEEFQTEYLKENNRAMDACDFVIGEHIWAFADFMTNYGLRRIDGNKKGIFTRQRQPKMAAFIIRDRWRGDKA